MKILNSCEKGGIVRTILFKNKRLEQFAWRKEGIFIVKRDILLSGFPIVSKYKIKQYEGLKL
jgi:hypothetical protein